MKKTRLPFVLCLVTSLSIPLTLPVAGAVPGARDPAAAEPGGTVEAAYKFALAKVLAEDGRMLEALELYPQAVAAAPDDPYIRIEYAEALLRVAQRYGAGPGRIERLSEAARQAEAAQRLSPSNLEALKALGQIHLSLSEYRPESLSSALEAFEGVRRQAPWDIQTMVTLGQIYLQQQEAERAAQVFREIASYTPNNRIVFSFLADALGAAGADDEAEEVLRKLIDLDPRALDSRMNLVKILARRGDHAGAIAALETAPEDLRHGREVRDELVWQLYLVGDFDRALAEVERTVAEDREGAWPRFVRSLILAGMGRNAEALAEIEALRADDPNNLELARTAAGVLEREGRSVEAARLLSELLTRLDAAPSGAAADEQRDRVRLLLAGVQARSGRGGEAVETLRPLLTARDERLRTEARIALAELLFDLDRREEALATLRNGSGPAVLRAKEAELLLRAGDEKRARKLLAQLAREADPEVLVQVAQAVQGQQRYDLSLDLLERAMSGGPRVDALFLSGAAYERTGRRDQAVTAFRRLLALDGDFAPALNYLGYMWAERGENLEEALTLVRRAVALEPDNGAYADSLGWALFQLGQLDEARRHLEHAVDLLPDDPTVLEHLADVYVALGDTERAEETYQRVIELAAGGDAADVRRKLDRLRVD